MEMTVDRDSILPVVSLVMPAAALEQEVDQGVIAIVIKANPKADEFEKLGDNLADNLNLFTRVQRSVIFPAADGIGSWKWDLMNALAVMEAVRAGSPSFTCVYQRVGYINKLVMTHTVPFLYAKPVEAEPAEAESQG